ncbi:flagellar basal-body MS-ring/collar protein FliF [Calorimonas adulescens]|jgi:flagellar basal-body M-ring protein/flagellar hook-basal body protein (fliF)|uniref:Flagellar M-ring protein n=1 Tax=Calorimonas adulescens TaxID=2606906 RepID=A0A5D8QG29_9THEO|nr:flagellar basal-body MS-ring/collar protein FliF [Calorimonas adulescens]TZE83357.1 flagellar M-ring protein FliF [Calorimonas adulescens]
MAEGLKKISDRINEFWASLNKEQRIRIIVSFVVLLVAITLLVYFLNKPSYVLLFSGLSSKDAGKVVEALENDYKVPYRLENGGTTIYVPKEYRDKLRIELSSSGLLDDGFTIDDAFAGNLSTTDMERQKKYQYFLQKEIENAIKSLDNVQDAYVVLSIPDEQPWALNTDTKAATAAIRIDMAPGTTISQEQVNGIIQFATKSVAGLKPENVTVIDNRGNILSYDTGDLTGTVNSQMNLRREVEETLKKNLQSMLEKIYGPGNVIVNVSAPLDFDYDKTVKTTYEPNSNENGDVINANSAIRSYQQLKESSTGQNAGGAAGTSSNVASTYPAGNNNTSSSDRETTTINYELNEIKNEFVKAQGQIDTDNISVSVAINPPKDENGQPVAIDEGSIRNLIKNSVGLTGDPEQNITIIAQAFDQSLQEEMQNAMNESNRQQQTRMYIILGLIAAAIVGGLLIGRRLLISRKGTVVEPVSPVAQPMPIEEIVVKENENDPKKQIERLIKQKPDVVAQLIRTWLNEE